MSYNFNDRPTDLGCDKINTWVGCSDWQMILCIILVQCMRLSIYLKFYVPFIIYELSFILMFRITITTKECLYSKNFTLTIRTTFCSVMIDKARVHSGGTISPYAFMMPAIAIDECTHSPKNKNQIKRISVLFSNKTATKLLDVDITSWNLAV